MKLQVSNTNAPAWRTITVSAEIPKELKPLEEMSKPLVGMEQRRQAPFPRHRP